MAYEHPSRPRRNTNDSTDVDLKLSRMSDGGDHQYSSRNGEFDDRRKSYVPPFVQDEHNDEERPTRMPSPPMSETSNPPAAEQQTVLSDEVIAQLTERIKKEVLEHVMQSGNNEATTDSSKAETIRNSESNDDEFKSEPMARAPSIDKSCSTPSPPPYGQRVYTPPSPNVGARHATISLDSPPISPVRSPLGSPTAEKPSVRFMNSRGPVDKDGGRNGRPAAYRSQGSNPELSTIDLKWGMLFDGDGKPTPRLKQFLKGLANHLIEDCHPRKSIVVTPDKMAAFYENHSVENEVYPLPTIFRSQNSQNHENLSNLYQELECQHHLVQDEPFAKPMIPALTPEGFAHWMTTWIRAYPEQEAKRLEKIVVSMPIDADGKTVDGKPERLPKQISRHLLPIREHPESKKIICDAITIFLDELGMSRTRKHSITGPSITRRTSTSTQPRIRPIDILQINSASRVPDRDQIQYRSPSDAVFVREAPNTERARQPYTAKPGNGKVYTETLDVPNTTRPGRAYSTGRGPRDHEPEPDRRPRHVRTHSNASSTRPGGTEREQSSPTRSYLQSDPTELKSWGSYPSEKHNSPKQSSLSPTSSYTTTKYIPSSSETRDRERDRERERYPENRRSERRNTLDQPRSRRNTLNNPSQLPPELTIPRNPERWEQQMYENRDKSRDRDKERKSEPKSAGPILHQEFRPDVRPALSDSPDEEWYLRAPAPPLRGGDYEVGKGQKYYERR